MQKELSTAQHDLQEANLVLQKIEKLESLNPRVSDHAVIRYMERKLGQDFDDIRKIILTDEVKDAINAGAKSIKFDGMKLRVKDKCITTVI